MPVANEGNSNGVNRAESNTAAPSESPVHVDDVPLAYLITFSCYGTWLRGDERGSVDRHHNLPGTDVLPADANRVHGDRERMSQAPYALDKTRRALVLNAIREVCEHRRWAILALHVRRQHAHCVVSTFDDPGVVMQAFKAYSTRALNRSGLESRDRKRWTRHGSTRKLWSYASVEAAIRYVIHEQGQAMAVLFDRSAVVTLENKIEMDAKKHTPPDHRPTTG